MIAASPPKDLDTLIDRCKKLQNMSIFDLSKKLNIKLPNNLNHNKGFLGQLLEIYLGASAKNLPEPDFTYLGIELKTIPIDFNNKPLESTYVCTAPFSLINESWETSTVKKKLNKLLWIPIKKKPKMALRDCIIGEPIFWQANKKQISILKQDWEELTEMLLFGQHDKLNAKFGKYLQIRPKAANSKKLLKAISFDNNIIPTVPKGFYLRTIFTKEILNSTNNILESLES